TPVVHVAALGLRDQLLRERPDTPGLGLGGRDLAVLEQRRGQVRQHQPLMRRRSTETASLGGGGHRFSSLASQLSDPVAGRWARPATVVGSYNCSVSA